MSDKINTRDYSGFSFLELVKMQMMINLDSAAAYAEEDVARLDASHQSWEEVQAEIDRRIAKLRK